MLRFATQAVAVAGLQSWPPDGAHLQRLHPKVSAGRLAGGPKARAGAADWPATGRAGAVAATVEAVPGLLPLALLKAKAACKHLLRLESLSGMLRSTSLAPYRLSCPTSCSEKARHHRPQLQPSVCLRLGEAGGSAVPYSLCSASQ